jgi:hypothetical protein
VLWPSPSTPTKYIIGGGFPVMRKVDVVSALGVMDASVNAFVQAQPHTECGQLLTKPTLKQAEHIGGMIAVFTASLQAGRMINLAGN